jgi:hypothetical protein
MRAGNAGCPSPPRARPTARQVRRRRSGARERRPSDRVRRAQLPTRLEHLGGGRFHAQHRCADRARRQGSEQCAGCMGQSWLESCSQSTPRSMRSCRAQIEEVEAKLMTWHIIHAFSRIWIVGSGSRRPDDLAVLRETHEGRRHRAIVRALRCNASAIRFTSPCRARS